MSLQIATVKENEKEKKEDETKVTVSD